MRYIPEKKIMEKTNRHILCSKTVFRRFFLLWDNEEKYGTDGQATDGNTIRRMGFACCIIKVTDTH
jgi:hypothetical protein